MIKNKDIDAHSLLLGEGAEQSEADERQAGSFDSKCLKECVISGFLPAFLISQKSKIFDSFPPGEAFLFEINSK